MKKIIPKMLILIILINFIIPKFSFATNTSQNQQGSYNVYESLQDGEVKVDDRMEKVTYGTSTGEAIASILVTVPTIIAATIKSMLAVCIAEDGMGDLKVFTIAELVSGKYDIFNNDFLLTDNNSNSNSAIKEQVSAWYYAIRNLAIIIGLLMLIYIGIRMAISTLSEDKVKYKKMLTAWLQSFIIIFVLHYLMIIAMVLQKALVEIIPTVDGQVEKNIFSNCWKMIYHGHGWDILWFGILYWLLTYYQVKFFFLYAKRMIATAFLMVIAPLITVTYSADKASDNKAEAFSAWFKEFLVNIFIQPLHLVIYLIFIVSAAELATTVPLLMVIFLGALSRGEKIIKGLFEMRNLKSINSMGQKKK